MIIVAIHGIGFSREGDLQPFLRRLAEGTDYPAIEANWNDIATREYSNEMTFARIAQLCRALNALSIMRPRPLELHGADRVIEWLVDLVDLYFTALFWILPPIMAVLALGLIQELYFVPSDAQVLAALSSYLAGYGVLLGAALVGMLILVATGAGPLSIARVNHIVVAGVRPGLVLAFVYLSMTKWRGPQGWLGSLVILVVFAILGHGLFEFFAVASDLRKQIAIIVATVYLVAPIVAATAIMPAIKLTLDVLLYITEPNYRDEILASILTKLEHANPQKSQQKLVLIGHSLGSVIAADLVCCGALRDRCCELLLVTAGSPIRRMFQGLLPGHLLPPDSISIIKRAREQFSFRWLNYYRPFDGIGARLGLPEEDYCHEVRSPLIRGPLSSHIGYWGEARFIAAIRNDAGLAPRE